MAVLPLGPYATTLLIVIISALVIRISRGSRKIPDNVLNYTTDLSETARRLSRTLADALPHNVVLPEDTAAFRKSMNVYWAQQENEVVPACIVQPHNVEQLSTAIKILRGEYEDRKSKQMVTAEGVFAIRSGGHSPISGAASMKDGVVIDMSAFCEVTPSADGSTVIIGAGAKWRNVSEVLDDRGLAVVGGRNSHVGVGGLVLGGGLSFFSPRFGFVCSNVVDYELVLADGTVTTASASNNSDLWQALKGGSNNFGVVTRITARSFPATEIWSGFLYMPPNQATKVLSAFNEFLNRVEAGSPSLGYDIYAAGPLASFTYLSKLGIQIVSVNLAYTKLPEDRKQWPVCWSSTPFKSLWRFWSTCSVRSLTNATDEMNMLNPPGRRQAFGTTTFKNDLDTISAAHAAYQDAIALIRTVKDVSWTMVLQPLLPAWARKGDPNPLGLHENFDEPLVVMIFTVNWPQSSDDEYVESVTRKAVERIDAFAADHQTWHRYRYLNYCGRWQRPLDGYGEENVRFLKGVSRKYDPEGLFQRGCVGGFKLDV